VSEASIFRYRERWSSFPQRMMALFTSVFCTSTSTPVEASTCESSSTTSTALKKVEPAPPYCSGISMPMIPSSKKLSMRSFDIAAA
jgi:hypothetical protein